MTDSKPGTTRSRGEFSSDSSSSAAVSDSHGSTRFGRRSILKLFGIAAVPIASQSAQAADGDGYGAGGYGDGGYGGSSEEGDGSVEPVVTTEPPEDIAPTSATLHGELVDADGADTVSVSFSWREAGAQSWESTASQRLDATGHFSESLEGLSSDTDYEVRAVADAGDGAVFGDSLAFTTAAGDSPDEPPTIDHFDVDEDSPPNPHAELHVEWTVSDPNADLERVTVEVFDPSGPDSPLESETIAVDDASASGLQTIKIKKGSGSSYLTVLTVQNSSREAVKQLEIDA